MDIASVAIYADDDQDSLHVEAASESYALGDGPVTATYLNQAKVLEAATRTGADGVHPGYGFLSENAAFAQALEERGIAFIGPNPQHLTGFGLKHEARRLAAAADVELLPGSSVLENIDAAMRAADQIGYPVMLKSSAGGGGIGMQQCDTEADLRHHFATVARLASSSFGDARLFIERCVTKPRHVEVQAFGDGHGNVVILGDRDCSLQRRHQKLVEECPAPNLPSTVRRQMHANAAALLSSVAYRSAGTVEFLYDKNREVATFLEVNTRLQVEHGVTELVYGVDLVRWMIELAAGVLPPLTELEAGLTPSGCAMQARLCAEDPTHHFRPVPGLLSVVSFPNLANLRVDTWLRSGIEVSPRYDSLLAKAMTHGSTRECARQKLRAALADTVLHGIETNRAFLHQALDSEAFASMRHDTATLNDVVYQPGAVEVLSPGVQTTVQQWPGRTGYWAVGVPPSGPMDDFSFRLGNRRLGNEEGMPGLEVTIAGPTLAFKGATKILVAGSAQLCLKRASGVEEPAAPWQPVRVNQGDVLAIGTVTAGMRVYVLFEGGLEIPAMLGSAATFTLGRIGGMNGRALVSSDVLHFAKRSRQESLEPIATPRAILPDLEDRHTLRITMGPHSTNDFLTPEGIRSFLKSEWTVHYHSSRTGVRLIGPKPDWARADGGEAGLHPSNIHDNAYAFGAIDFTGDMPVVLGPDGPSLGGFVCPAAVIEADRWKLGQLGAGDRVKLIAVTEREAHKLAQQYDAAIADGTAQDYGAPQVLCGPVEDPIVFEADDIVVRRAAQDTLLAEFGSNVLDFGLRLRVDKLETSMASAQIPGVLERTAGIRSLLIRFDRRHWTAKELSKALEPLFKEARVAERQRPSRIVHMPLSWDDPACREAIDRYVQSVRQDAPWCPDNIEFIRRINGLATREAVKDIVLNAEYLVMGLGDVYLGAPVAAAVDPRHRLVTTKYNPARIWTAENSVGIGGAYLCVYGMEGPGGYQFVGRTLQVWNRYRRGRAFDKHWLLRPFDRICFHEVSAKELLEQREAFSRGALDIAIEDGVFDYESYLRLVADHAGEIGTFEARRQRAFSAELEDWRARGVLTFESDAAPDAVSVLTETHGTPLVTSPLAGSVWSIRVKPGQKVSIGEVLFVVESMKTEFEVKANSAGVVGEVLVSRGQTVRAGEPLAMAT